MKRFQCPVCGNEVFFDSSICLYCRSGIGYTLSQDAIAAVRGTSSRCANADLAGCTWIVGKPGTYCESCLLTRTRPADADLEGLALFPVVEQSKRHLLRDITRLGLTLTGDQVEGQSRLAFDLLSSVNETVTIGHAEGVITIDLAEGDDSHRERVRGRLAEPYRTMLGHFRHESGHYAEWLLLERTSSMTRARTIFGDERADYQDAVDRHYRDGAPVGWQEEFISEYATMHPYEDFASAGRTISTSRTRSRPQSPSD